MRKHFVYTLLIVTRKLQFECQKESLKEVARIQFCFAWPITKPNQLAKTLKSNSWGVSFCWIGIKNAMMYSLIHSSTLPFYACQLNEVNECAFWLDLQNSLPFLKELSSWLVEHHTHTVVQKQRQLLNHQSVFSWESLGWLVQIR